MLKWLYYYLRNKYSDYRFRRKLRSDLRQRQLILVHTMGKVGSTSIHKSIEKSIGCTIPVFHTHYLNSEQIEKKLKNAIKHKKIDLHLVMSQYIRAVMDRGIEKKKWKIITLVRDPISRNISAFFENIERMIPNFMHRYTNGDLTIEKVIDVFLTSYPNEEPFNWLDREIKSVFGIDVYSVEFPKNNGYIIINRDYVSILLLKLENLTECSQKAFSEFMGLNEFYVEKANEANKKEYSEAYSKFKQSIQLPETYIEKMYKSKYAKHFYSEEEIEGFRIKWLKSGK